MGDTRLFTDNCSYSEQLKRSIMPGLYSLNTHYDDCSTCGPILPNDPYMRFQHYGPNSCTMKKAVDDNSELLGLNYKNSKCNSESYIPGKYNSSGCVIKTDEKNICGRPTESTKLSNPPCTLKGTGINRWEWLCYDPQEYALEDFNHIPTNVKLLHKDNHSPLIENPDNNLSFFPNYKSIKDDSKLESWKNANINNTNYAPGYPYGNNPNNYNLLCKTDIKSY